MEKKEEFIRVGTTLYKIVDQPRIDGGYVRKRIAWNSETLRQDYGKDYMASVPKYDGFCTVPDHVGYKPVVGKFLNLYEPISHVPRQGDFPCIRSLVEHIFGEQYELGMDYLQLLYLYPVQKLPILLLVSEERNTGKSTFLNFLKAVFQNNVTFNTNEDFRSQFNSDWAGKLLIMVDEVLLNRREDSERLKNLSTTLSYKVEAKGKDRDEIGFFAKFVLCSNNEYLPVIIDAGETRYWVRKIVPLQSDDTDFLQKLKTEIPAFLHYLVNRKLSMLSIEYLVQIHSQEVFTDNIILECREILMKIRFAVFRLAGTIALFLCHIVVISISSVRAAVMSSNIMLTTSGIRTDAP